MSQPNASPRDSRPERILYPVPDPAPRRDPAPGFEGGQDHAPAMDGSAAGTSGHLYFPAGVDSRYELS